MTELARNAAVCDADECDTWTREPEMHGFLQLVWGELVLLFCSPDCTLKWLATNSTPMEVIE